MSTSSTSTLSSTDVNVGNSYIDIVVGPDGTYTMGTAEGTLLLSGYPNPWSSYLSVKIDDVVYVLTEKSTHFPDFSTSLPSSGPTVSGDSIVTIWNINDIEVNQTIKIIASTTTGNPDAGLFQVSCRNTGTVDHEVGARFMFDTMLGNNDAAPFKVPGTGDVTTETEYFIANMPDYWQAFDNPVNPTIISQGTLNSSMDTPGRFILGRWADAYASPWDYVVNDEFNGDSATVAYWYPETLSAGSSVTHKTAYGLGRVVQIDVSVDVPEFPSVALPVLSILGLMFIAQRRK